MEKLFSLENSVMQFLSRAGEMMIANVLFLVCSLPIVTGGAALTALNRVMQNIAFGEDTGNDPAARHAGGGTPRSGGASRSGGGGQSWTAVPEHLKTEAIIPMGQELDITAQYLDLMGFLYGEQVLYHMDLDPALRDMPASKRGVV